MKNTVKNFDNMVTEYRTVLSGSVEEFTQLVNQAIAEGWQPFGNLTTGPRSTGFLFIQPMVK